MLALQTVNRIRCSRQQFKQLSPQQFYVSIKLLSSQSSSSSSSSDSSDSDSDKEDEKIKKIYSKKDDTEIPKISDTNQRLDALLRSLNKITTKSESNPESNDMKTNVKRIDVAIKKEKKNLDKLDFIKPTKEKPYDQQLVSAAKDVAKSIKGDPQVTELELLSQVLNLKQPSEKVEKTDSEETIEKTSLSDLLTMMKVDILSQSSKSSYIEKRKEISRRFKKDLDKPSITSSVLQFKSSGIKSSRPYPELKTAQPVYGLFKALKQDQTENIIELPTWNDMEQREIKLSTLSTPQNVFQELIQWTDQGKLWKFPINNEQGMEKEESIHFSEHVFVERHLKGWCPKKGPIRHFMELVCTGLSKNPYMTVEEKIEHVMWYKNYFEDKKDMLKELELLENKPIENKKQIEA